MQDTEVSRYNAKISDTISEFFSKLVFVSLEIGSVNDKTYNQWLNDHSSKKWIPLIKSRVFSEL